MDKTNLKLLLDSRLKKLKTYKKISNTLGFLYIIVLFFIFLVASTINFWIILLVALVLAFYMAADEIIDDKIKDEKLTISEISSDLQAPIKPDPSRVIDLANWHPEEK